MKYQTQLNFYLNLLNPRYISKGYEINAYFNRKPTTKQIQQDLREIQTKNSCVILEYLFVKVCYYIINTKNFLFIEECKVIEMLVEKLITCSNELRQTFQLLLIAFIFWNLDTSPVCDYLKSIEPDVLILFIGNRNIKRNDFNTLVKYFGVPNLNHKIAKYFIYRGDKDTVFKVIQKIKTSTYFEECITTNNKIATMSAIFLNTKLHLTKRDKLLYLFIKLKHRIIIKLVKETFENYLIKLYIKMYMIKLTVTKKRKYPFDI